MGKCAAISPGRVGNFLPITPPFVKKLGLRSCLDASVWLSVDKNEYKFDSNHLNSESQYDLLLKCYTNLILRKVYATS